MRNYFENESGCIFRISDVLMVNGRHSQVCAVLLYLQRSFLRVAWTTKNKMSRIYNFHASTPCGLFLILTSRLKCNEINLGEN